MLYDCFMLLDELDLLEIRLHILDPLVDKFVITEATTTQMGAPKPLVYDRYRDRFSKFHNKIIYNVCDDHSSFKNQWERERFQRNYIINGIKEANDADVAIFSDLDEIPNPLQISDVLSHFEDKTIYHFAQRMFNFYFNYENIKNKLLSSSGDFINIEDKKWIGTRICSVGMARQHTVNFLREKECLQDIPAARVSDGGWHFSYMGGNNEEVHERVKRKLQSFSHEEFNHFRYYNPLHIKWKTMTGKDFLGRDAKFKKVAIDESYPEWLRLHYKGYPHFVL